MGVLSSGIAGTILTMPYTVLRAYSKYVATASASYDDMIAELPQSVSTPELLLAVDDVTRGQLLRELAAQTDFPGARVTTIDGLQTRLC